MRCNFFLLAAVMAFLLMTSGCRSCDRGGSNSNTLPAKVPPVSNVEYVKSDDGLPPRVKDATDIKEIQAVETRALTTDQINELDAIARANDSVRAQLGDRSRLLHSYYIDSKEGPAKQTISLTYYSYANNYAVQVIFEEKKIIRNEIVRDFQPPATTEEISEAVSIAVKNQEVKTFTGDLQSRGIVSYRKFENKEIQNHRIIYVSFSKKERDNIEYYVYVDLTQNSIIEHGKDVPSRDNEDFKKEYLRRN